MSEAELREAHRGFGFNTRVSEATDVDRTHSDKRSEKCMETHEDYPANLPDASIVIIFHNEHLATLLRTVHSLLNTAPPRYLRELILVDDASEPVEGLFDRERWEELQAPLEAYIKALPKVRLLRLSKHRGIMGARMEGVWRADGAVAVFLDSHVEATPGWLEPLLSRIADDRTRVVMPRIDTIDADSFEYHAERGGVSLMGFTWSLADLPYHPSGSDKPEPSPIMAGGLFAADRAYFLHLGGYDTNMTTWGGEESEIGFRTWQCGGSLEFIPCSHVGHLYRSFKYFMGQPYKRPREEVARNKRRTAEVWMDEYKGLVQLAQQPLPPGSSIGSVDERLELRRKLGCRSFGWFLDHMRRVAPQFPLYVPQISQRAQMGALSNPHFKACVDTRDHPRTGKSGGGVVGVHSCTGQHGPQAFLDEGVGLLRAATSSFRECLGTNASGHFVLVACAPGSASESLLTWDGAHQHLQAGSAGCLTATSATTTAFFACREGSVEQQWQWISSS